MTKPASLAGPSARPRASSPWQFSLASLMEVMLFVAVFCGLWRIAPQLTVLVVVMTPAAITTWRLVGALRRRRLGMRLAVLALFAWSAGYLVSVGPAVGLTQHTNAFDNIVDTLYAPLDWLYRETPLEAPLEWYVDYWRGREWKPG